MMWETAAGAPKDRMHAQSPRRRASLRWLIRALGVILPLVLLAVPASAGPQYAGIVIDVLTGNDLYAQDADEPRYPASLTKIMTLYVLFEEISAGRISLEQYFEMSAYAAGRPPSKLGIPAGGSIKVRDAIKALVTKSANDVATAVGENIAGSESAFAARMTATARRLGMSKTTFRNASGLPNSAQKTTARDMARLGIAIQRDFPQYYGVFQTRVFEFGKRRYGNHNRLLGRVRGVDGIKTGYINASGFNLVTSVRRDGRHLVAVVMGGRTGAARNQKMTQLVESYLPKARRGEPMAYAAWSDSTPPPIPGRRPSLAVRFASRLTTRSQDGDPIGQTVMAFAAETRATFGTDALITSPRVASEALQAVIAQAEGPGTPRPAPVATQALPDGEPSGAPVAAIAFAPTAAPAPAADARRGANDVVEAVAVDVAAAQTASTEPAAVSARFSAAFSAFGETGAADVLAAAIDRTMVPASGVTIIAMGSAPQLVGERVRASRSAAKAAYRLARTDATLADAAMSEAAVSDAVDAAKQPADRRAVKVHRDGRADAAWQIQIGAVPTQAGADGLLDAAVRTEPALAQHPRVTISVTTAAGTLYRARFGGFQTQADAQTACKRFTNHNRPCWAVPM